MLVELLAAGARLDVLVLDAIALQVADPSLGYVRQATRARQAWALAALRARVELRELGVGATLAQERCYMPGCQLPVYADALCEPHWEIGRDEPPDLEDDDEGGSDG